MSEQEKQMIELLSKLINLDGMDSDYLWKTDLISLGLNSLGFIKYLLSLEDAFHFEIKDYESVSENATMGELYKYLLENNYFVPVNE